MKILVCVSKVPDTTTKIKFTADQTQLDTTGVQWIINPYDEHGLSKALELKEKHGGIVNTITVDNESAEPVIRKCLAIGADEAVRVNALPLNAHQVAKNIAETVKDDGYDLIICGRESIDYNGGMVADLIGEYLNIPTVNLTTSITFTDDSTADVRRFIDGGHQTVSVSTPFAISATKELAEPRIPNMRGIMMARKKSISTIAPVETEVATRVEKFEPPKEKGEVKLIDPDNAEELIRLLREEAKVL